MAHRRLLYCHTFRLSTRIAEVVELADALRSGRSEGNLVGVRVPPSAPTVMKGMGDPSAEYSNAEGFFYAPAERGVRSCPPPRVRWFLTMRNVAAYFRAFDDRLNEPRERRTEKTP